jgi:hypothetical protein
MDMSKSLIAFSDEEVADVLSVLNSECAEIDLDTAKENCQKFVVAAAITCGCPGSGGKEFIVFKQVGLEDFDLIELPYDPYAGNNAKSARFWIVRLDTATRLGLI